MNSTNCIFFIKFVNLGDLFFDLAAPLPSPDETTETIAVAWQSGGLFTQADKRTRGEHWIE
jgi:hypothetical protein